MASEEQSGGTGGSRLGGARADFVASLGRKVADARDVLGAMEADPTASHPRDELRRKLHALGTGARLLRFDAMARSLQEASSVLERSAQAGVMREPDTTFLAQVLDDLPALAWGEAPPREREAAPSDEASGVEGSPSMGQALPASVLFGVWWKMFGPHAAFLIQRGLKTYPLRRAAQCATAGKIATLLAADPRVTRVHYPGLASHPGHALAAAQLQDFGSIVTIDLSGTPEQSRVFADSLELFAIAASLGSCESLIVAPQLQQPRDLSEEQRRQSGVTPTTARLSIGLEDPEDLIADLCAALDTAFG